jgi:SAM-dependent methyltransferase
VEAAEYRTLYDLEPTYWWFRHLHAVLADTLGGLHLRAGARVLDAGCGTGQALAGFGAMPSLQSFGFDLSEHARPFWRRRGLDRVCQASIHAVPFASGSFDAVVSVDVLECDGVDPGRAIDELVRVLAPGGHLLLVVPAYRWLLTPGHHRAVHASRRFTGPSARALIADRPLSLVRLTHLFAPVLPAVAAVRLALRALPDDRTAPARSELRPLPAILNAALERFVGLERRVLPHGDLPFGSSILVVARKVVPS